MARIDYSDPAKADDRTREILGKNRNANIFRMMAHSPSYFEQYCRLGGAIRHRGELDPVVRELAITRTGILCEAPYEIVAHKRIGKNVGVTDEQNAALEDWQPASCFNELQRAALAFTDEIVKLRRPTDATFKAIAVKLTPAALIELQLSVGFYIMTSKFLETFGIDLQPVTEVVVRAAVTFSLTGAFRASGLARPAQDTPRNSTGWIGNVADIPWGSGACGHACVPAPPSLPMFTPILKPSGECFSVKSLPLPGPITPAPDVFSGHKSS